MCYPSVFGEGRITEEVVGQEIVRLKFSISGEDFFDVGGEGFEALGAAGGEGIDV